VIGKCEQQVEMIVERKDREDDPAAFLVNCSYISSPRLLCHKSVYVSIQILLNIPALPNMKTKVKEV
jgi:hypothetical protein